ncbi:MAG: SMC-Scp complex subunit ScpB [Candidatus Paceibacterota bacterium]
MQLDRAIEAILFYKAAPMKKSALAKILEVGEGEVSAALKALEERLKSGATALVMTDEEVELAVAPQFDSLIENLRKDELKRDIGKAGAETLAIVLYRSPVSRGEIDRIRGVNSSYILRALETRGLIERSLRGQRSEFVPTTMLMRHLGISEKTGLSDYVNVMNALENFEKQQELEDESR